MQLFQKNIINIWGKSGQSWLTQLPHTIESLKQTWSLTGIKPVANLSYNYVAFALQNEQSPVVLKISYDAQSILAEHQALKHFAVNGAISVIDFNKEKNALLLAQAQPGRSLKLSTHEVNKKIIIYSEVVKNLKSNKKLGDFPHVKIWCDVLDEIQTAVIPAHFVAKAKELRNMLLTTMTDEYICHGDLHLDNILQQQENWLAIDPKGIIAEIAFEAAAFDFLYENATDNVMEKITARADKLACALNIDINRLLAWIFLRAIISALWFIEDKDDPKAALQLAEYIYSLIK